MPATQQLQQQQQVQQQEMQLQEQPRQSEGQGQEHGPGHCQGQAHREVQQASEMSAARKCGPVDQTMCGTEARRSVVGGKRAREGEDLEEECQEEGQHRVQQTQVGRQVGCRKWRNGRGRRGWESQRRKALLR